MTDELKHSPTPWSLRGHNGKGRFIFGLGPGQIEIGEVYAEGERGEANAEFIVRAVNSHDALLEAARLGLKGLIQGGAKAAAAKVSLQKAIAQAEAEAKS